MITNEVNRTEITLTKEEKQAIKVTRDILSDILRMFVDNYDCNCDLFSHSDNRIWYCYEDIDRADDFLRDLIETDDWELS